MQLQSYRIRHHHTQGDPWVCHLSCHLSQQLWHWLGLGFLQSQNFLQKLHSRVQKIQMHDPCGLLALHKAQVALQRYREFVVQPCALLYPIAQNPVDVTAQNRGPIPHSELPFAVVEPEHTKLHHPHIADVKTPQILELLWNLQDLVRPILGIVLCHAQNEQRDLQF